MSSKDLKTSMSWLTVKWADSASRLVYVESDPTGDGGGYCGGARSRLGMIAYVVGK